MSIAVIDYGSGNLKSAAKALETAANNISVKSKIIVTSDPEVIKKSNKVILPGQGSFRDCYLGIKKISGLEDTLNEFVLVKKKPIFGICLGHQILALALGAKTKKMKLGHRGANHPVKNLIKSNVEITSQNHGFEITKESLPKNIEVTHKSLFDNCVEGIRLKNKPVFSVQYHPESNPGPQDSVYLFQEFINNMKKNAKKKRS